MMQAAKKIPFEDPNVLNGVRALYVLSNVIIFGVYMYTKMQIDKKRGMLCLLFPSFSCEETGAVTGRGERSGWGTATG
jgi:hypothetical protein